MAGFQDQLIGPAPYRETIPVDAYTRVGMIKQEQFEQGVQKVQSYIDSVVGIDALMPEQKDYLNQRVGQLQTQVTKLASEDFSNQQIVNSVGHLTNQIAADPIIQNTVYSASAFRNEQAKMKTAQEAGKSSPANETIFGDQVANWMNSHDPSKAFSATYHPYVDYKAKMIKALNDQLAKTPDEYITEMPFKRGANGQPLLDANGMPMYDYNTLIEKYKGVSAERIKNIVDSSLDDNDRQQISIDGQYQYRGYGKNELKGETDRSYNYRLGQINSAIDGLKVKRQTSVNDPEALAKIDREIDQLGSTAKSYQESYLRDIDYIDKNPEGYKSSLYEQNWLSKFSEGYSYAQHSLTYGDNPGFKAAQQELENKIKFQEFQETMDFHNRTLAQQYAIEQDKLGLEMYKAGLKGKIKGAEFDPTAAFAPGASFPEPIPKGEPTTVADWANETQRRIDQQELNGMTLLSSTRPELIETNTDDKGENEHFDWAGKTQAEREANKREGLATLNSYKDGTFTGEPTPAIKEYYKQNQLFDLENGNRMKVAADANEKAERNPNLNTSVLASKVAPITVQTGGGNTYTISGAEQVLFNQKMEKIHKKSSVLGGSSLGVSTSADQYYYDDQVANELLKTPKEKYLYSITKKPVEQRSEGDTYVLNKLSNVFGNVNIPNKDRLEKKFQATTNIIRPAIGVYEPVSTALDQFKAGDKQASLVFATQVLGPNPAEHTGLNFDAGVIGEMLTEKNASGTRVYVVDRGKGKYALRYTNTAISPKQSPEIDLTPDQINNVFGNQLGRDTWEYIGKSINQSKIADGPWTTNVQRKGATTALPLADEQFKNYKVRYDVEQDKNNNTYQIKVYVYDKIAKEQKEVYLDFNQPLNRAQVLAALPNITDETIKAALDKQKLRPSPPTAR